MADKNKKIMVRISERFKGGLFLPGFDQALTQRAPTKILDEDIFNSPEIQSLVKRGILINDELDLVDIIQAGEKIPEKEINIKPEPDPKVENNDSEINKKEDTDKEHKMFAWNMEDNKLISKEDSTKVTLDRINSTEMEVHSKDVDFSEENKKYIIYKEKETGKEISRKERRGGRPFKDAVIEGNNIIILVDSKQIAKMDKKAANKIAIKPVGEVKPEPKVDDPVIFTHSPDDILFVDEEQDNQRLRDRGINPN